MHRITKLSLDRIIARRNGAQWREHLVGRSIDVHQPVAPLEWSRLWLRRRLVDTDRDRSNGTSD